MNIHKKQLLLLNRFKGCFWILIIAILYLVLNAILHLIFHISYDFFEQITGLIVLVSVIFPFYYIVIKQKKSLKEAVEKLNQSEKELRKTNQTLFTLIEALPLSIVVLDPDGRVKKWNSDSEQIFGWSEQEVLGRPHPIVLYQKQEEFYRLFERVLQGEINTSVNVQCLKKDGSPIDIHLFTIPIRGDGGHIVGAIGIVEDITQPKKMEVALYEAETKFRTIVEETLVGVCISRIIN
ncbi:MAG: PAS domain-containing protein [Bacillota bacterium]